MRLPAPDNLRYAPAAGYGGARWFQMEIWHFVLVGLIIYLDGMAIYYAYKTDMYEPLQLSLQALLVVLVPVVGALFVIFFSVSQINRQLMASRQGGRSRVLELFFLSWLLTPSSQNGFQNDESGFNNSDQVQNSGDTGGSSGE